MPKCLDCNRRVGVRNSTQLCNDCGMKRTLTSLKKDANALTKNVQELEKQMSVVAIKEEKKDSIQLPVWTGKCGMCNRTVGVRKSTCLCWSCELVVAINGMIKLCEALTQKEAKLNLIKKCCQEYCESQKLKKITVTVSA